MDYNTLDTQSKLLEQVPDVDAPSLYEALQKITDGRKRRGVRYEVALILTLLLLGKLAGCKSIRAVTQWVQLRTELLLPLLPTSRPRFPCQATYGNVLKVLDAEEVTHALAGYLQRREKEQHPQEEASRKEEKAHVALDGKTLRGTLNHLDERQPSVHLLSLYEPATGIVLAQRQVESKQNEISAVQQWLNPALVKGRIVTTDALHTEASATVPMWCALEETTSSSSKRTNPPCMKICGSFSLIPRPKSRNGDRHTPGIKGMGDWNGGRLAPPLNSIPSSSGTGQGSGKRFRSIAVSSTRSSVPKNGSMGSPV